MNSANLNDEIAKDGNAFCIRFSWIDRTDGGAEVGPSFVTTRLVDQNSALVVLSESWGHDDDTPLGNSWHRSARYWLVTTDSRNAAAA